MPIPQPETSELLQQLNEMVDSRDFNEFALTRIRRRAEDLKRTDAAGAYTILGMVGALVGDLDAVRKNHKAALNLNRGYTSVQHFATSLFNVGASDEAIPYYREALRMEPGDIAITRSFINALIHCFRYREAATEFARLSRLAPDQETESHYTGLTEIMAKYYDENSLTDDAGAHLYNVAFELIKENEHRIGAGTEQILHEDDGDLWIDSRIALDCQSGEELASLNVQLAERASSLDPRILSGVCVRFVPIPSA